MSNNENSSCSSHEASLSQLSQKTELNQLDKEVEKEKENINRKFENKFEIKVHLKDRKEAVEYINNLYGKNNTLRQYGRGGNTIKLRCINKDCCFKVVCARKNNESPFLLKPSQSEFSHAIINQSTGRPTDFCNSRKKITTVIYFY